MTPYQLLKLVILKGGYNKADIEKKVSAYYRLKKLTKAEYDELTQLILGNNE